MKSLLSTCAALALAGALFVPAASAQTVVTPRQEALGLPSGPYLLNCTGARAANGSLVALCDDRATATQEATDTWRTAQMPLTEAQQCNGAVVDMRNGRLACGTPAMVAANMGPLYTGAGTVEQAPMVGSSTPPQNYGSSFGTSGPTYGYPGAAMTESPATPPYAIGASGYPQGQPVAPATKSYYPGSSAAPQNYGSSLENPGSTYGYPEGQPVVRAPKSYYPGSNAASQNYGYSEGQPVAPATEPNYAQPSTGSSMMPQNYSNSSGGLGAPYDRYTTGTPGQSRTPPNPE